MSEKLTNKEALDDVERFNEAAKSEGLPKMNEYSSYSDVKAAQDLLKEAGEYKEATHQRVTISEAGEIENKDTILPKGVRIQFQKGKKDGQIRHLKSKVVIPVKGFTPAEGETCYCRLEDRGNFYSASLEERAVAVDINEVINQPVIIVDLFDSVDFFLDFNYIVFRKDDQGPLFITKIATMHGADDSIGLGRPIFESLANFIMSSIEKTTGKKLYYPEVASMLRNNNEIIIPSLRKKLKIDISQEDIEKYLEEYK